MIVKGQVMNIFRGLISGLSEVARSEMASAIAFIAASRQCREILVNQSAAELLIAFSITSDSHTKSHCVLGIIIIFVIFFNFNY